MPGLRYLNPAVCKPNPRWTPPEAIAIHADKLEEQITQPPEDMLFRDTDGYAAFCWEWTGKVRADDQAFVWVHGNPVPIHRFAYLLWVDDVPEGMFARPIVCGTKLCVCPTHLRLVARGHRRRKLTDKQMDDIRWAYYHEDGGWSQQRLAETYGVSQPHIHRVVSRRDA